MLQSMTLRDVGPVRALQIAFAPRLNLLLGENGLGKTFVLDLIWYGMTWTWAGQEVGPHVEAMPEGSTDIDGDDYLTSGMYYYFANKIDDDRFYSVRYHRAERLWKIPRVSVVGSSGMRRYESGDDLLLYARADGGFALWDAYRNIGRIHVPTGSEASRPRAFLFQREQVWDGLAEEGRTLCNGLIRDWVSWQQTRSPAFEQLGAALAALSSPGEPLSPGEPTRVRVDDVRDIPTLVLPYGSVPLTLASAGMRRICSLAYMLVWAWQEHRRAASLRRAEPVREFTLLVDEIEAHLHPSWQRSLLPALLGVVEKLAPEVRVQVVVATHAPLVTASVEPLFDPDRDGLYHFHLAEQNGRREIAVERLAFAMQGDVGQWLESESFGLSGSRSIPSEQAISAAMAFMRGEEAQAEEIVKRLEAGEAPGAAGGLMVRIHQCLLRLLPGHDPFWVRWVGSYEGDKTRRSARKRA